MSKNLKTSKPKKDFMGGYKTYDTSNGFGSAKEWRSSFSERMSKEEAQEKFGFLMGAFEYGAPPHGGIALGFDRLCALLGGQEGIRDFIAFPKNNSGRDVMLDAPSSIDDSQMKELGLKVDKLIGW